MKKAIIFDLDGTLLDTLDDLTNSVNYTLDNFNMNNRTKDECRLALGHGIKSLIKSSVPEKTTKDTLDLAYKTMLSYYKDHSLIKTKPYIGTVSLIKKLKSEGYLLAICTNKDILSARKIEDKFFNSLFDVVVGDDKVTPLKPNNNLIEQVKETLSLKLDEIIYIGDSEVDIETSKNSLVDYINVSYGFRTKKELSNYNNITFAEDTEDLYRIIKSYK